MEDIVRAPLASHPGTVTDDDPRWQAVLLRDASADGAWLYAVKSTGIYCRPSCPSRRPSLRHVGFYADAAAAEAAGFRPCKRCHPRLEAPGESRAAMIDAACRALAGEAPPPLAVLARRAGLSPFHFHRLFKAATGVTPRRFAEAAREARARDALPAEPSVTHAIHASGYASPRRFYERADAMLGMSPRDYRRGGDAVAIAYATASSSLGRVLVAATERGVCAVLLGDDDADLLADLTRRFGRATIAPGSEALHDSLAVVLDYLETPRPGALPLPLDLVGTLFQQRVWQALQSVPAGETLSYAGLAERLGEPKATRAVAGACAANPVAVIVPCHRILRKDGGLSGYRWGIERKKALLARERLR